MRKVWEVWRSGELDGFQILSGVLALLAGPIMLVAGVAPGWAVFVAVDGIVLLVSLWAIANRIELVSPGWRDLLAGLLGLACLWLAAVYLTRDADGLPRLLPGFDGDSERFLVIPGVLTLVVGVALVGRAIAAARPRRLNH